MNFWEEDVTIVFLFYFLRNNSTLKKCSKLLRMRRLTRGCRIRQKILSEVIKSSCDTWEMGSLSWEPDWASQWRERSLEIREGRKQALCCLVIFNKLVIFGWNEKQLKDFMWIFTLLKFWFLFIFEARAYFLLFCCLLECIFSWILHSYLWLFPLCFKCDI